MRHGLSECLRHLHRVAKLWSGDDEDLWWTDDSFCYDLGSFDRLVIDAKASADVEAAWHIIEGLIKRISRGMAVMVLKAFPLDYEGEVTLENRQAFDRRKRALVRLYQRRMRFAPAPLESLAKDGWMLRLFNPGAAPDVLPLSLKSSASAKSLVK